MYNYEILCQRLVGNNTLAKTLKIRFLIYSKMDIKINQISY